MRILHVVHHLGGGLETAIEAYVSATPEFTHDLLYSPHPTFAFDKRSCFSSELETKPGLLHFAKTLRRVVDTAAPDVVHAHSSIAGAIARAVLSAGRHPIVYTPHCFAFERRDVSAWSRRAYEAIEAALARRTAVIAACSPREALLAEKMSAPVRYIPNVARLDLGAEEPPLVEAKTYVACGRITEQKDPMLFARLAQRVPGAFEWIGGGKPDYTRALESAGVVVTGWLDRTEALRRIQRASAYIHTAEWEGAPMTVIEAAALGKPVIARDTPALRALGCAPLWSTIDELVEILNDEDALEVARERSAEITRNHSSAVQTQRLRELYTNARATRSREYAYISPAAAQPDCA